MHSCALHAFSLFLFVFLSLFLRADASCNPDAREQGRPASCRLDKSVGRILYRLSRQLSFPLRKNSAQRRVSEIPRLQANLRTNSANGRTPALARFTLLDFSTRSRTIRYQWFLAIPLVAEFFLLTRTRFAEE